MSRYKPNRVERAEWWDPDEDVTFLGSPGFLRLQRVRLHQQAVATLGEPTDDAMLAQYVEHMAAVLLELLKEWRLRKPVTHGGQDYKEGLDRPVLELSTAEILELPIEDISYLYQTALTGTAESVASKNGSAEIMTPEAVEVGLNSDNFRPPDADPVDLPG